MATNGYIWNINLCYETTEDKKSSTIFKKTPKEKVQYNQINKSDEGEGDEQSRRLKKNVF